MEILVPWWWEFFFKDYFVSRGYHCTHFFPIPKPTQSFPKGKALLLRIIKSESEKVLEKCEVWTWWNFVKQQWSHCGPCHRTSLTTGCWLGSQPLQLVFPPIKRESKYIRQDTVILEIILPLLHNWEYPVKAHLL